MNIDHIWSKLTKEPTGPGKYLTPIMPTRAKALIGKMHAVLVNARIRRVARSWPKATPLPHPSAQRIRVSGFFNESLGIGCAAHLTASALAAAGYSVVQEDIRPLHRHLLRRQPEAFEDALPADVWIIQANPPETRFVLLARDPAQWRDTYRIAYWVWGSSLAPRDWVQWAAYFHEIWVPSPAPSHSKPSQPPSPRPGRRRPPPS